MILLLLLLSPMALAFGGKGPPSINPSWPNSAWQDYVVNRVDTLPRTADEREWCPAGLTKPNMVHLLAAIVSQESNFKPHLEYKENFKNRYGEDVISTGLFQLSYSSARGYGFSGITTEDLKNPYKNIDVALVILKKWMLADGVVANSSGYDWKGGARYWSVLRHSKKVDGKWVANSANKRLKTYLWRYCQ